jgi:hypothetical protein
MAPVDLSSLHRQWEWRRFPSGLGGDLDQQFAGSLTALETDLLGEMGYPAHLAYLLVDMYGPEL